MSGDIIHGTGFWTAAAAQEWAEPRFKRFRIIGGGPYLFHVATPGSPYKDQHLVREDQG